MSLDFTSGNCLFGAVKLAKNAHPDKYGYSGYDNGYYASWQFLLPDGSWSKNVIIFGVGDGSSVHVDNKRKDILVLGEGPTQEVDNSIITAEATYSINLTELKKKICVKSAL